MKLLTHLAAPTLAALLTVSVGSEAHAGDWQVQYESDGVKVSRKSVEGSKFLAFKGETTLNANQSKVLYVLMDQEHRKEWVDRLYTNYILQENSKYDYVIYQAFELPAIFSNRDYVYRGQVTQNDEGTVFLDMQSVEHPKAPETVGVRANLVNSRYVLTAVDDNSTYIEVEIMTDPQGMMPAWLVNLIQKSWPVKTLNGIKTQLGKSYTGEYPLPNSIVEEPEPEPEPEGTDDAPATDTGVAENPVDDVAADSPPADSPPADSPPADSPPADEPAAEEEAAPAPE